MGFKDFKAKMKSTETQEKLKSSFEEKSYTDDRYWTPQRDKNGNFSGLIRFLPAGNDEEQYFVKMYSYAFQNKATEQWYIENSRQTINQPDPIAQANQELWNTGIEENKNIVRGRKRQTKFIANIYVHKDGANPDNDGKVFLFKYGKAIHNKIDEAIKPQFADDKPINPYDMWEGANFKVKIMKDPSTGFPNYDRCGFEDPSALFDGDDERIESEVYNKLYPLQPEVANDKFKTFDELLARFMLVEGKATKATQSTRDEDTNPDYHDNTKSVDTDVISGGANDTQEEDEVEVDESILDLLK